MESLYRPDKERIPSWMEGIPADEAEKENELILPEGRTR
jgi:hypothetical protein